MLQDIFKDFDESILIILFLLIFLMGDGFGHKGHGFDDILLLIFLILLLTGGIF